MTADRLFFTRAQIVAKLIGLMEKIDPMEKVFDNFDEDGAR